MRRVRYQVACSLDGYIAGPDDAYDWIVHEPAIDFDELFARFDTLIMGRRTYEIAGAFMEAGGSHAVVVVSATLDPADHPGVRVVRPAGIRSVVEELKGKPGKDIWLFGGGQLFRTLLELGLVDTVEPAIIPVLVGGGVPFLPAPAPRTRLRLTGQRSYPSGIVWLEYAVDVASAIG